MLLGIELLAFGVDRLAGSEDEFDEAVHRFVDVAFFDAAGFDGFEDFFVGIALGARHFEVARFTKRFDAVVIAAPVGDDDAVEPPLFAKDVAEQVMVFVGVHPVKFVVGSHESARLGFLDRDFEGGQIDFAQGPFIDDRIAGHTADFLVVAGEVLDASGDAVILPPAWATASSRMLRLMLTPGPRSIDTSA